MVWGALALSLGCSGKIINDGDANDTAAAGGGSAAAMLHACLPVQTIVSSVNFDEGSVLAAGRGADGIVYVVTQIDSKWRLFRTDLDGVISLFGSGVASTGDGASMAWKFDYWEWGRPVSLGVVRDDTGLSMAVLRGATSNEGWHLSEGEPLTVLTTAETARLTATLTQTFSVSYQGRTPDGRFVVVIGPGFLESFEQFRVFWGKPSDLREHVVTSFDRNVNVDLTYDVTFETSSGSAHLSAVLPVPYPASGGLSEGTLELSGKTETLTGPVPPTVPDGTQFFCL